MGGKGISRMIYHIKSLHLSTDERRAVLRDAISLDLGVFMSVAATLKEFGQWICGDYMSLHALSRSCRHSGGLVKFNGDVDNMSEHIVGIQKPPPNEPDANLNEGVVLDAQLLDLVFKLPITTIKSIPHNCCMDFSQALKAAISKVVAHLGSIEAWVTLLILPRCTLQVFRPKNRQESMYGNKKSLQHCNILSVLATWGTEDGMAKLVKNLVDNARMEQQGKKEEYIQEDRTWGHANFKQCLHKVVDGHFTAAMKVLCSSGVAPYGDATTKALEDKHPHKPPPSMSSTICSVPPLVVDIDNVL